MTVRNQNVKVYRGNSASLNVTVTQADGTPYDPSLNAVFRYRIALTSHANEEDAMVRKTSGGGGIAPATGSVVITLNPGDTDFEPGVYYHELRVTDGADVATAMTGAFVVRRGVLMGDRITTLKSDLKLSATVPTRAP